MKNYMMGNGIRAYHSCIILLLFMNMFAPSVTAADTMFRANPGHTGVFDNGGIVTANTELWRFKTGGAVYSSPAVSNGVVYVGSDDDNLYAVDAMTGAEKWRFKTGGAVYSSPAVSNGIVYVGGNDHNLYAVDAVTGMEKWRFPTGDIVTSSPAVSNGVVFIYSKDSFLYAIDAATGFEKWRFPAGRYYTPGKYIPLHPTIDPSPTVENGSVYFGQVSNLYAIDTVTGVEKWRFVAADAQGLNFGISSSAVANGMVYISTPEKYLYAVDAVTGKEKWKIKTDYAYSSPSVADGAIFVGGSTDGYLYAVNALTGKITWRLSTASCTSNAGSSSSAISDGVVFVGSNNDCNLGYSQISRNDHRLSAIDAVTGTVKWQFRTDSAVESSPAVSNGVVFFGSDDGNLYAVGEPSSQAKTQTTTSAQTTAHPQILATNGAVDPEDTPPPIGDRNNLIYLILLVFVLVFGALVYDTYYKKKK